jgi:hypothetical protein
MRTADQQERRRAGVAADGVSKEEVAHPTQLVERFDEMAGFVVWAVLLATLLALAVLLLEIVLVAVVASLVFSVRALRGRWQCEVVGPGGRRWHVPAGSLSDARRHRDEMRDQLAAGLIPPVLVAVSPPGPV